jgi:hypothetical protein
MKKHPAKQLTTKLLMIALSFAFISNILTYPGVAAAASIG